MVEDFRTEGRRGTEICEEVAVAHGRAMRSIRRASGLAQTRTSPRKASARARRIKRCSTRSSRVLAGQGTPDVPVVLFTGLKGNSGGTQ